MRATTSTQGTADTAPTSAGMGQTAGHPVFDPWAAAAAATGGAQGAQIPASVEKLYISDKRAQMISKLDPASEPVAYLAWKDKARSLVAQGRKEILGMLDWAEKQSDKIGGFEEEDYGKSVGIYQGMGKKMMSI